jgi:hypothetical protein
MEKQIQNINTNQLEDDWIKKFEEEDKKYEDFYKEDNYYVNLHFIYINQENSIEKIKQEKFFMNVPNYITREEILYILKKHTIMDDKKYSIFSLLRYNITLNPEDVPKYLNQSKDIQDFQENQPFLTNIKNIDTIFFEKTISIFQDLNDLFFILRENIPQPTVSIRKENQQINTHNKNTKKVFIKHSHFNRKKGTRRL